jgi:hypothetical protein
VDGQFQPEPLPYVSTKEAQITSRFSNLIRQLSRLYPSVAKTVDLWRPMEMSTGPFSGQSITVWTRLEEGINAVHIEKEERFYQAQEGIIWQRVNWLFLPDAYGIGPNDHIVLDGEGWLVIDNVTQQGWAKLTIDKPKSRFRNPAAGSPTYRMSQMKAKIGPAPKPVWRQGFMSMLARIDWFTPMLRVKAYIGPAPIPGGSDDSVGISD